MPARNPKIDAYITKSGDFAKPILNYIRSTVHAACPNVEETLKWRCPHFVYHGKILCGMAAFKAHCNFGFWHSSMESELDPYTKSERAMGNYRRVTKLSQLPKKAALVRLVVKAMQLTDDGVKSAPAKKPRTKQPVKVPADLLAALRKNKTALAVFNRFSPSHQREYSEWISAAKRPETRQKRVQTAIDWLGAGKSRNWKYERK